MNTKAPLEKTRALMVATSFPSDLTDWRGVFIRHLVDAMARRPDVELHLWAPPGEIPENVTYAANSAERTQLKALMAAGGISHLMRQRNLGTITAPARLLVAEWAAYRRNTSADLYHVNWLQNALVLPRDGKPVLMAVLGNDLKLLRIPFMKTLLRRACRGRNVAVCPNSEWMVPTLARTFGDLAKVRFIPFGINANWFRIERRLPGNAPAQWLCVTRLTARKIGPLFEWGERYFSDPARELHLFGPMQEDVEVPAWVHYHGPASPEMLREQWFPGAHGLITLSQHSEGRPQVMLEAMAAGLPIIASRIPAHVDMIAHQTNGWLCDGANDLGLALDAFNDRKYNVDAGLAARAGVLAQSGTWDDCAARYAAVYDELLEGTAR